MVYHNHVLKIAQELTQLLFVNVSVSFLSKRSDFERAAYSRKIAPIV